MSYASLADVQGQIPVIPTFSASTRPTDTQVTEYLTLCAGEIDAALASRGLSVPVATPAWFLTDMERLNAQGAAAMTLMGMFPQEAGPGSNSQGANLWKTYQLRLSELRKGIGVPMEASVADSLAPRSYFTDNNAIGNSSATDDWGDTIISDPTFQVETVF